MKWNAEFSRIQGWSFPVSAAVLNCSAVVAHAVGHHGALRGFMYRTDSVIAIYEKHEQAEQAVQDLDLAGFDLQNLSIAAKGAHAEEEVVGFYNISDRMLYGPRGERSGAPYGA